MSIGTEDRAWLKTMYRQLRETPLEPDDPRYEPIYQAKDLAMADPIEEIARVIEWDEVRSTQLLSGFRGTGKSTELRRLRKRLTSQGAVVVLTDIEDYLNTTQPIDISDFLMFLAGAFGDALVRDKILTTAQLGDGFFDRAFAFIKRIDIEELTISAKVEPTVHGIKAGEAGTELKLGLKDDPSFRARLQKRLAGYVGRLVGEVEKFFEDTVQKIRQVHGADVRVVFLVDSIEHIRGTFSSANDVQSSIENLFVGHHDKLRLPAVHMVCTVPPWLKVRHAQAGTLYDGFQLLTAIRVSSRGDSTEFAPGIAVFKRLLDRRGDWMKLLGSSERMRDLIQKSGGHPRDLLRLMIDVTIAADTLPVTDANYQRALSKLKNEMLPIADEHAVWMSHIFQTQRASLEEASKLPDLARFLDTHQVLAYRNGDEWYDVHPLIADEVVRQAAEYVARRSHR